MDLVYITGTRYRSGCNITIKKGRTVMQEQSSGDLKNIEEVLSISDKLLRRHRLTKPSKIRFIHQKSESFTSAIFSSYQKRIIRRYYS